MKNKRAISVRLFSSILWEAHVNMADAPSRHSDRVLLWGIVLSFFAIPHLIDDFLFDIPEEFGISDLTAQVLSGIFIVCYLTVLILASRERRVGYVGGAFLGGFLALAVTLKHIPLMWLPGPYWSGWFSEMLIVGVLLASMGLLIVSLNALRKLEP